MNNNDINKSFVGLEWFIPTLSSILVLFSGAGIICSNNNKKRVTYSLKKDLAPLEILSFDIDDNVRKNIEEFDLEKIADMKFGKQIQHFIEVIQANFKEEDLAFISRNIKDLKVGNMKFMDYITYGLKLRGYYNSTTNGLNVERINFEEYLYHELFHCASSYNDDEKSCVGFAHANHKEITGRALNEGYTQFLTNRYFPIKNPEKYYPYFTKISGILEEVIGQELMQSLYIRADLRGLIDEISYYSMPYDAEKFITNLDAISTYMFSFSLDKEAQDLLNHALYEVNSTLTELIVNKVVDEVERYEDLNVTYIYEQAKPLLKKLPTKVPKVHFKCDFWDEERAFNCVKTHISYALNNRVYYPQKNNR